MYPKHDFKKDHAVLNSTRVPEGYELQSAILVSGRDGSALAPAVLSLRAADWVHCSRCGKVRPPESPLDELDPTMSYLERQQFARPLVHLIDAEADSVGHFRQWSRRPAGYFLVRADDRLVENAGQERRGVRQFAKNLAEQAAFRLRPRDPASRQRRLPMGCRDSGAALASSSAKPTGKAATDGASPVRRSICG